MRFFSLLLLCLYASAGLASANPYGTFPDNPVGEFINHPDRPHFKLHKEFVYYDPYYYTWIAPNEEVVDGASIPKFAWSIVGGPFSGQYLNASIIHDYYCCTKSRNYYDTNEVFRLGMLASGVSAFKARLMWLAVRIAGPAKWVVDTSKVPPKPCNTDKQSKYALLPVRTQQMTVAKYTAIVRTLNTTNGLVVDIVEGKPVFSESEHLYFHIDNIYTAVQNGFDYPIEKLGLFSIISEKELGDSDKIMGWQPGQIPALDEFMMKNGIEYKNIKSSDLKEVYHNPWKMDLSTIPDVLLNTTE